MFEYSSGKYHLDNKTKNKKNKKKIGKSLIKDIKFF